MNGRSQKRTLPLIESLHPKDVATENLEYNIISQMTQGTHRLFSEAEVKAEVNVKIEVRS